MSVAAFAREHGIGCSTLHAWRHQARNGKPSPRFVEVELTEPSAPVELLIELGPPARLRLSSVSQIELAAQLLQRVNATKPC
jgi:transposase-like protein